MAISWTKQRIVVTALSVLALIGIVVSIWFVDRMALAYLTGQRRVPGKDWFGRELRMQGPPPGYLFLGFSRPSKEPPGFELVRPSDTGLRSGLKAGDVVVSVNGKGYGSSFDLVSFQLANHNAGESVPVDVRRGQEQLSLEIELQAFYRSPKDLDLAYEEVEIDSNSGFLLRGWFIPPPTEGDGRAVVFVHGANSSRFQALDGAKIWHDRGYGLLTMDLSGRGTSQGDYITFTVNERDDVRSMVESLRVRPGISAEKVLIFGTSNGAASAIYAASALPNLPVLVLDTPYSDLWTAAEEMLASRGVQPRLLPLLSWAVWWRAGIDLKAIRPLDAITGFPGPVLFVHGDSDTQVPPHHTERMHERRVEAGLPSSRLLLPGGEHGFDNYPEDFWDQIVNFCDQQLGGAWRPAS